MTSDNKAKRTKKETKTTLDYALTLILLTHWNYLNTTYGILNIHSSHLGDLEGCFRFVGVIGAERFLMIFYWNFPISSFKLA